MPPLTTAGIESDSEVGSSPTSHIECCIVYLFSYIFPTGVQTNNFQLTCIVVDDSPLNLVVQQRF